MRSTRKQLINHMSASGMITGQEATVLAQKRHYYNNYQFNNLYCEYS